MLVAAHGSGHRPVSRTLRATTAYLVYSAGEGVFFRLMTTIYSVFAILELGLDPLQLVLMGTILEGTYLLFEVPTGVVADTFGRRTSIVVGLIGTGVAFTILGSRTPSPWPWCPKCSGGSSRRSRAGPMWRG